MRCLLASGHSTGSENNASPLEQACGSLVGDPLAELRHEQLNALQLPMVGYANAIDLGDPTSPFGNVHFQNKQVISRRLLAAAMTIALSSPPTESSSILGLPHYPPPRFLGQTPVNGTDAGCAMTIHFDGNSTLMMGATKDPGLPLNGSSAVCPSSVPKTNCSSFELLCATPTPGKAGHYTAHQWVGATPTLTSGGKTLTLKASNTAVGVARGSRYAWGAWPLATLFENGQQVETGTARDGHTGLPILPWNQALTM